jgi:RNase P subunit RPR2
MREFISKTHEMALDSLYDPAMPGRFTMIAMFAASMCPTCRKNLAPGDDAVIKHCLVGANAILLCTDCASEHRDVDGPDPDFDDLLESGDEEDMHP